MKRRNLEFLDAKRKDHLKLQKAENSGPSPSAKDPQLNSASCDALGKKSALLLPVKRKKNMASAVSVRCSADWEKRGLSEPMSQWVTAPSDVTVMWGWSGKRMQELQLDAGRKPRQSRRRTPDVPRHPYSAPFHVFISRPPTPGHRLCGVNYSGNTTDEGKTSTFSPAFTASLLQRTLEGGKKIILLQTTEPKPGRGASNVPVPFVTS